MATMGTIPEIPAVGSFIPFLANPLSVFKFTLKLGLDLRGPVDLLFKGLDTLRVRTPALLEDHRAAGKKDYADKKNRHRARI